VIPFSRSRWWISTISKIKYRSEYSVCLQPISNALRLIHTLTLDAKSF
jgi:hypothetical protein